MSHPFKNRAQILKEASSTIYDVVVIGGGITGAGILRDLASRKVQTLLIEKGDFASGTSSKSGKLIHGGLRYLRYGHLKMVWESCQERILIYKTLAPHLVTPVHFNMPFYAFSKTPMWLATIGLFIYDSLSSFKNIGRFKKVSLSEIAINFPGLITKKLNGALSYFDCFCLDTRLTIENLKTAESEGVYALNYAEMKSITRKETFEIQIFDHIENKINKINARQIILACGAWSDEVLQKAGSSLRFNLMLTSGLHIIIRQEKIRMLETLALEHPVDKRNLYFVPWNGNILIGTTDNFYDAKKSKDQLKIEKGHVDYLLRALQFYFPDHVWTTDDIVSSYMGIRPLIGSDKKNVKEESISRDFVILKDDAGLFAICGGKLTTYRRMAREIGNMLFPQKKSNTAIPLFGAQLSKHNLISFKNHPQLKSIFIKRYGLRALPDLENCHSTNEDFDLINSTQLTTGEVRYLVIFERCHRLSDVVMRRTDLFFTNSKLHHESLIKIASILLNCHGLLTPENLQQEVSVYERDQEITRL